MTTTTERIANAVRGIVEEDRRADRERIAELERDKAHFASVERTLECWQELIDDLNRQLDEAHKENARLILAHPHHTAPVVEEQGPWVLCSGPTEAHPFFATPRHLPFNSALVIDAQTFATKQEALEFKEDGYHNGWIVITLAEARAIEAKRG